MDKFYENFRAANSFLSSVGYFKYINQRVDITTQFGKAKKIDKSYCININCMFPTEQEFNDSPQKNANIAEVDLYISKDKNMSTKEIVFAGYFIKLYCAYGYIYDLEKNDEKTVAAKMLFILSYIYNTIKLKSIPFFWQNLEQIVAVKNYKSFSAAEKDLEEKDLLDIVYPLAKFMKENVNYLFVKGTKTFHSFEKNFTDGLADDATKKLRSMVKENERKEHPVQTRFFNKYPFFSSMAALFKLETDLQECKRRDIYYGAVDFYSNTIYINEFNLSKGNFDQYMDFIFAHEMLHVALNHYGRKKNRDMLKWNLACDFVINHWLVEMKVGFAPDGVYLDSSLAGLSAEEIYIKICESEDLLKRMTTMRDIHAGHSYKRKNEKDKGKAVDMFGEAEAKQFGELHDAACAAMLQGYHVHKNMGRGALPAGLEEEIRVLEQPSIPWEVELASWISYNLPVDEKKRTYARVSRRPSISPDMPLPKWIVPQNEKKSKTFGVVLDTSGSMDKVLLGKALGAIAAYSKQNDVLQVRLICCDTEPYDLGYVNVDEIKNKMKLRGRGGTVLQPALDFLETQKDFPKYAPVLILTDGYFEPGLNTSRASAYLVPDKSIIKGYRNVFEFS